LSRNATCVLVVNDVTVAEPCKIVSFSVDTYVPFRVKGSTKNRTRVRRKKKEIEIKKRIRLEIEIFAAADLPRVKASTRERFCEIYLPVYCTL